jgi:hypothetical protein
MEFGLESGNSEACRYNTSEPGDNDFSIQDNDYWTAARTNQSLEKVARLSLSTRKAT